MIECKSVQVVLQGKDILDGITVHFARGRIHGIIGRNGSGKTMLLKALSGYLRPTGGSILVDGKELYKEIAYPPSMGLIIETPSFNQFTSGRHNLTYLAGIRGQIGLAHVNSALSAVGMLQEAGKLVRQYSLGMKQRLAIAQAIMEDPALLLLDEPFNGLDKAGLLSMHTLLQELRAHGKTILLASHNPVDIQTLCDTVHEMEGGKLGRLGTTF